MDESLATDTLQRTTNRQPVPPGAAEQATLSRLDEHAAPEESSAWLRRTKLDCEVLAEAYRLRLVGRLWWANMALVVLPAAGATAAAVFAASAGTAASSGNVASSTKFA